MANKELITCNSCGFIYDISAHNCCPRCKENEEKIVDIEDITDYFKNEE